MVSVTIGFGIFLANFIYLISQYIISLINVRNVVVSTSPLYMMFFTVFPAVWWAYSTKEDSYNFYNRKNVTLRLVIVNDLLVVTQAVWTFSFNLFVYRICTLPVGRNFSEEMILNLCRIALAGTSLGTTAAIYKIVDTILASEDIKEGIETFRWQHIVDDRKNKNHLYDLDIVRRMSDGRHMIIKEVDRFVHMFILGQSGTGKTSSTFLPAIICDLNKKLQNMIDRHAALVRMIKNKEAKVEQIAPFLPIDEHCVRPVEGKEGKYHDILKRFPDCGVTLMAPNSSANKSVIALCKARKIPVNVIDPAEDLSEEGVLMKGLNPLYIPAWIDGDDRQILISNRAQNFAEVLLAVSEIHGVGDQYFRDINASVTTNVAIVCMLDANLRGTQTNIRELQECIQDFTRIQPKITAIMNYFNMEIVVSEVDSKKNERKDKDKQESMTASMLRFKTFTYEGVPQKYKNIGWTETEYEPYARKQGFNYYPSLFFVLTELLGGGYAKMFDQARGLRNIINNLMLDPRIANLLCADEATMLDFDRMLFNNEITVINTALEFGSQSSTALGVFIILNLKLAVMRRASIPEAERTNHFIYIDEASQYMHPVYEDMFALFRQYRVAVTLALQSQTQMDKSPVTKYLRGVIRGAGTHMVFGRADSEEMKYYEELMGMEKREVVQTQVNSNSEFDENYSVTKGQRVTLQEEAAVTASQIRIRDFQEVTMLMIDRGRVLKGFIGKVRFPAKKEFKPMANTPKTDFAKYAALAVDPNKVKQDEIVTDTDSGKEIVERFETNIKSVEKQDAFTRSEQSLISKDNRSTYIPPDEVRDRVGEAERYKSMVSESPINDAPLSEVEPLRPQITEADNALAPVDYDGYEEKRDRLLAEEKEKSSSDYDDAEDINFSSFLTPNNAASDDEVDTDLDNDDVTALLKALDDEGDTLAKA